MGKSGSLDLVFAASVGAGILALARGRPRLGYLLLTVGALERPEGWVMLTVVLVPALRPLRIWESLAWLAVAPLGWLATGMLFGDPLASVTVTQANAADFDDPTGLGTALRALPDGLASGPGWVGIIIGLLGLGVAGTVAYRDLGPRSLLASGRRSGPVTNPHIADSRLAPLVVAFLVADLLAFLAVGAMGAAPIARYLVCAQFLLLAMAGGLVGVLWNRLTRPRALAPFWRLASVSLALALLTGAVHNAGGYRDMHDVLTTHHRVESALTGLLTSMDRAHPDSCRHVSTPVVAQLPVIATTGGRSLDDVSELDVENAPADGVVIYPRNLVAAVDAGFGPSPDLQASFPIPPGYQPADENQYWVAFSSC